MIRARTDSFKSEKFKNSDSGRCFFSPSWSLVPLSYRFLGLPPAGGSILNNDGRTTEPHRIIGPFGYAVPQGVPASPTKHDKEYVADASSIPAPRVLEMATCMSASTGSTSAGEVGAGERNYLNGFGGPGLMRAHALRGQLVGNFLDANKQIRMLCGDCPEPRDIVADAPGQCLPYTAHRAQLQCMRVPRVTLKDWCERTQDGANFGADGNAAAAWKGRCEEVRASAANGAREVPMLLLLLPLFAILCTLGCLFRHHTRGRRRTRDESREAGLPRSGGTATSGLRAASWRWDDAPAAGRGHIATMRADGDSDAPNSMHLSNRVPPECMPAS